MTFVRKRRVTHKPKDIVAQEPMAERENVRTVTHTILHHGSDILEITVRTLPVGDGFFCTKRAFTAIEDRLNGYFRSERPKKFKSREWGLIQHIRRVA